MRAPPFTAFRRAHLHRCLLLCACLLGHQGALAQGAQVLPAMDRGGIIYLEAAPLALALGVVAVADGNVLTWRGEAAYTTLFSGSPDALSQPAGQGPQEVTLSAPVLQQGGGWFLPLDALPLLGVPVPDDPRRPSQLTLTSGLRLPLHYFLEDTAAPAVITTGRASWEPAEPPLAGVRFFDGDGVSLLLLDLSLLPLAAPLLTGAVDQALVRAHQANDDHVLLLLVTALADRPWEARLLFQQEGRQLELAPPFRLLLQQGEADRVTPHLPVVGAVLLPPSFNLYKPLQVTWGGAAAEVRFRR